MVRFLWWLLKQPIFCVQYIQILCQWYPSGNRYVQIQFKRLIFCDRRIQILLRRFSFYDRYPQILFRFKEKFIFRSSNVNDKQVSSLFRRSYVFRVSPAISVRIFPRARSSFPIVKLSTWEQSTKPVSRRWTSGAIACYLEIREKEVAWS